MGDPGLPVMAGVLTVPIGVFVLVLLLAMMGRRWALAGPPDVLMADDIAYEEAGAETVPAADRIDPAPSGYTSSSAYDPYGSPAQRSYGSARRGTYGSVHEAIEAPRPDPHVTPAQDPYGTPVRERHTPPPAPSRVSDWAPYIPAPRRSQEGSSWSSYGSAARSSYGSSGSSAPYDGYGHASRASDRDDRPAHGAPRHRAPQEPWDQEPPHRPYDSR